MIGQKALVAVAAILLGLALETATQEVVGSAEFTAILMKNDANALVWISSLNKLRVTLNGKPNSAGITRKIDLILLQLDSLRMQQARSLGVIRILGMDEPALQLTQNAPKTQEDPHWGSNWRGGYNKGGYHGGYNKGGYKKICRPKCKTVIYPVPKKEQLLNITNDMIDANFLCFDQLCNLALNICQLNLTGENRTLFNEIRVVMNATRDLINNLTTCIRQVNAMIATSTRVCSSQQCYWGYSGYSRRRYGDSSRGSPRLMAKLGLEDAAQGEAEDGPELERGRGPDTDK